MGEQEHPQSIPGRMRVDEEGPPGMPDGASAIAPQAAGNRTLGRYRLRAVVRRGRLGEIFEAVDETSLAFGVERSVAIQLLDARLASDPSFIDRLRRGYAALRAGSHPNVVEVFDFARDRGQWFFVMELFEGASLRYVLDCVGTLPIDEVLAVVRGVGDALQYLHAKSMLHGRVTPENVFVTDDYEVKLLDVVPVLPASTLPGLETSGSGPGSAPDARDDVFGVACLAYELLAGRHPFNSSSPLEALRAKLAPMPIESLPVPRWRAIERGLALERERRPPTIGMFMAELGLEGTERLRPDDDRPTEAPARPPAATPARPPRQHRPDRLRGSAPGRAVGHDHFEPALARRSRRGRVMWRGLGLAATACIVAVVSILLIPPDEQAVERTSGSDAAVTAPDSGVAADAAELREPTAAPAATTGRDAAAARDSPADRASIETVLTAAEGSREAPALSEPARSTARPPPAEGPPDAAAEPVFGFAEPTISAGEGMAAVQVPLQRASSTGTTDSVVWWTADRTALADEDYGGVAEQHEEFAPGEEDRALYVPLVDDSLPEPAESFLVYVGRYSPRGGQLEIMSQVTVDIVDDD